MMITRHFATIPAGRFGPRQVHYRRAGQGPLVLLLHQSPLSSRDLEPTMQRWCHHFTMLAPDTPGYGLSDPFGRDRVEMEDIADAVVEFMDAVGIECAPVYGFHTGAMIAAALAESHPERVACAAVNGYAVLTREERDDILAHYLPRFAPSWDGSHLTWLWARLREQTVFFPWYSPHLANRMNIDMPAPDVLQTGALEFLRAGDNYRIGYRAAFTFDGIAALARVGVPTLVTAAMHDPLHAHLERIRAPSATVQVRSGGSREETLELARDFLARHAQLAAPPVAPTRALTGRVWNDMVDVPGGQIRVRRNDDATGVPVIVQHDAASASDTVDPVTRSFAGHRPVLAIDLPGHGESDNTIGEEHVSVARYVDVVWQVLDALGCDTVDTYGMWGGGLVGLEMASQRPHRIRRLAMSDVLWFDDALMGRLKSHYTPPIEVNWYGGHLLNCWHLMRDQALFWPWFDRTRAGIIRREPHVDPAMVHQRAVNMLKAPVMWRKAYQAHFDYPLRQRLAQVEVPVLLCAPPWDPNYPHTEAAAAANPRCDFRELPEEMSAWGAVLMDFFDATRTQE
jgi:pimeloyl-ACP methyl ester carboxylesterase